MVKKIFWKLPVMAVVVLLSFLSIGCATVNEQFGTITREEERGVTGITVTEDFLLEPENGGFKIYLRKLTLPSGAVGKGIQIYYYGSDWIFMSNVTARFGETIYQFKDDNPYHKVRSGGNITEMIAFVLTDEQITSFLNTSSIAFEVSRQRTSSVLFEYSDEKLGLAQEFWK